MPRSSRPITVTLGELQERVEARVASGAYASASEVMRAAVRALDREEAEEDLTCVAAAVPATSGSAQFALSVSFLTHRLKTRNLAEVGRAPDLPVAERHGDHAETGQQHHGRSAHVGSQVVKHGLLRGRCGAATRR